LERVEWSAEEFSGELADRVRRDLTPPTSRSDTGPSRESGEEVSLDDDDSEAA
jgi:hypothetical protein